MDLQLPSLPLLLSLVFLLLVVVRRSLGSKPKYTGLPPTPWKLPFIGNLHHLIGKLPHVALRDLARAYGPVILLRLGQVDFAVFSSREAAQEVLKTQDINFATRPELTVTKILLYDGTDIASSNGNYWRQVRRIGVMELLSAKRVKNFASIRSEETYRTMMAIAATPAGETVDLREKLLILTNAIVTRACFGKRCSRHVEFLATVKDAMELSSGFSIGDLYPSMKILDILTGLSARAQRIKGVVSDILDSTIQEHQESRREGEDEDLIDVLLRVKEQGALELPMTYDNIKAVIIDMFFAGTDSTAIATEWAMSELMRCPSAMAKLQNEVREAVKEKGTVEVSNVAELSYLRAVVKETLRLHPPVLLLLPRYVKETCKVLDYTVPAGTRVLVNAWALARDPRYWTDAESFNPERFVDGDAAALEFKGNNFEYLPFGAGRRICPGITFGLASVELALARLIFHFDWQMPNGMKPQDLDMTEVFGLTSSRKETLKLVAIPRYPFPPSA